MVCRDCAANGTYTATLPAPTADGPLTVTVNSTDAAGQHRDRHPHSDVDRGTHVTITGVEGGGLTTADTTINALKRAMAS
jgi:hypothetical protein